MMIPGGWIERYKIGAYMASTYRGCILRKWVTSGKRGDEMNYNVPHGRMRILGSGNRGDNLTVPKVPWSVQRYLHCGHLPPKLETH